MHLAQLFKVNYQATANLDNKGATSRPVTTHTIASFSLCTHSCVFLSDKVGVRQQAIAKVRKHREQFPLFSHGSAMEQLVKCVTTLRTPRVSLPKKPRPCSSSGRTVSPVSLPKPPPGTRGFPALPGYRAVPVGFTPINLQLHASFAAPPTATAISTASVIRRPYCDENAHNAQSREQIFQPLPLGPVNTAGTACAVSRPTLAVAGSLSYSGDVGYGDLGPLW